MGAYTRPNAEIAPGLERVYAHFPRLKERRRQVAGTLSGLSLIHIYLFGAHSGIARVAGDDVHVIPGREVSDIADRKFALERFGLGKRVRADRKGLCEC